jgi:multiple sugar transport system ATP-binding protein
VLKTEMGAITVRASADTKLQVGQTMGLMVTSRHNNWFHATSGVRMWAACGVWF